MSNHAHVAAKSIAADLVALPAQPSELSWPTRSWPRGELASHDNTRFEQLSAELFDQTSPAGVTYALLVIKQGVLVHERYGAGANPLYLQYSWSMAKSVVHALTGILVGAGKLDLYAPIDRPEWQGDARRDISLDHLLRMSSGLAFNEDYVNGQVSDVIAMLQFEARHDMAAFAAGKTLSHPPGRHFSYSSGTTNIIAKVLGDVIGNGASGMLKFMNEALFEPIGIRTATPRFDSVGTFVGSSFLFATPQDFARFGLLYLRDGVWDGQRILPPGWVDYARSPTFADAIESYGAHWWLRPDRPGWFYASGYDCQRIICAPEHDIIIVRCGRTPEADAPYVSERLDGLIDLLAADTH